MCKTCNGTGGINTEHSWGITFHPCPDSHCEYKSETEKQKRLKYYEYRLAKLKGEIA
ncbi:hypothetical protein [Oceanobacillus sp. Castelsardo]|uniref:hypothetical protein n=1 Tax=Oceanobacillus sp. Castelsardo TaxID=1851204 RepID=UPI0012E93B93|nr:hypothetical protein [Oceanobacillus sp. Castelsardo]